MIETLIASNEPNVLLDEFSEFMSNTLKNDFWQSGSIEETKVLWTDGKKARKSDRITINSAGLYIWGGLTAPIYVGKTLKSFNKRFGRYVWQAKSQCNLAKEFESALIEKGIDGFSEDIFEWYKSNFSGNARLNGATRFAQEGIGNIWFTLLPCPDTSMIGVLESRLILIAEDWNKANGQLPLLNKQS